MAPFGVPNGQKLRRLRRPEPQRMALQVFLAILGPPEGPGHPEAMMEEELGTLSPPDHMLLYIYIYIYTCSGRRDRKVRQGLKNDTENK